MAGEQAAADPHPQGPIHPSHDNAPSGLFHQAARAAPMGSVNRAPMTKIPMPASYVKSPLPDKAPKPDSASPSEVF